MAKNFFYRSVSRKEKTIMSGRWPKKRLGTPCLVCACLQPASYPVAYWAAGQGRPQCRIERTVSECVGDSRSAPAELICTQCVGLHLLRTGTLRRHTTAHGAWPAWSMSVRAPVSFWARLRPIFFLLVASRAARPGTPSVSAYADYLGPRLSGVCLWTVSSHTSRCCCSITPKASGSGSYPRSARVPLLLGLLQFIPLLSCRSRL